MLIFRKVVAALALLLAVGSGIVSYIGFNNSDVKQIIVGSSLGSVSYLLAILLSVITLVERKKGNGLLHSKRVGEQGTRVGGAEPE